MASGHFDARRQILEVWRAAADFSMREREWRFGGFHRPDSIGDAEQLLTLLRPATHVESLRLEEPGDIAPDVADALHSLGSRTQIPRTVIRVLGRYLDAYTDRDGGAVFSGAGRLDSLDPGPDPTPEQLRLDLTASFAVSVHLCLAALGFLDAHAASCDDAAWLAEVREVRERVSNRLTAALVGLLRGFVIDAFDPDTPAGSNLVELLNQDGLTTQQVVDLFGHTTIVVRGRLSEARVGVARDAETRDPAMLFEIGWTWGIAEDSPQIILEDPGTATAQREGCAISRPDIRATLLAVNAIHDLDSDRTRVLRLLTPQQQRLALNLGIRRDLSQLYWSRMARFGRSRWPVEDLPWRSVDGRESYYLSLLVASILVQDLRNRTSDPNKVYRTARVLTELAQETRISRRALRGDGVVRLHATGFAHSLDGAERLGPSIALRSADLAALLLKCGELLANVARRDPVVCERLLHLGDEVWEHLRRRRILTGTAAGLWDDPSRVYGFLEGEWSSPRWDLTYAAVDALAVGAPPWAARPIIESVFGTDETGAAPDADGPVEDTDDVEVPATLLRARSITDLPPTASGTRLRRISF